MIASIIYGFAAAFMVSMALAMGASSGSSTSGRLVAGGIIIVLVALTAVIQKIQSRRSGLDASGIDLERYDGCADLLIHLHTPALPDRAARWTLRGLLTWILAGLGLGIGPEGVGTELSQAAGMNMRTTATRWSDLRRRTDAAQALSAGMSAGFGAPFAAVLLPAELAIGGRVLSSVLASVSAYVGVQYLTAFFGQFGIRILSFQERLQHLWGFRLVDASEWFSALVVCALSASAAGVVLFMLRGVRALFDRMGGGKAEWATLFSGVLLISVLVFGHQNVGSPAVFFESVIRNELSPWALSSLIASLFLVLAAVYGGLGTLGVWWPSFLMGAAVSMLVVKALLLSGWIHSGVAANSALLGAVAWTVVWFRTPITLSVLAFELSGRGSMLLPALLAGWLAGLLADRLCGPGWIDSLLVSRGFPIRGGRSLAVLKSLTAGDAMVRDFQTVRETDSIEHCYRQIRECRYPFLAVVNNSGAFKGLLTVDMIDHGVLSQQELAAQEQDPAVAKLEGLLEAKDLLFRSEIREPIQTAREQSPLDEFEALFESQICVPVLSSDGRPVGLLFSSDVRHAYDRELARISFIVQAQSS